MNLTKGFKMIKRIVIFGLLFLFFGCNENPISTTDEPDDPAYLKIDARLNQDSNGYYHLRLDRSNNQTIHILSGDTGYHNYETLEDYNKPIVTWYALDLDGNIKVWEFMFMGQVQQVPIANNTSQLDKNGFINIQIAPVISMLGDTTIFGAEFISRITPSNKFYDEVYIIFD